jgi:2-methylcitrate dehydratase PrpD
MNGYYIAAVTLLDGDAFVEQFAQHRLADRRILNLVPLVEILHDPELDRGGVEKRHAVNIEALLKNGKTLSAYVEQRRGSVHHPLPAADVERKFRRLASASLSTSDVDAVMNVIRELDRQSDMKELASLLTRDTRAAS